MAIIIIQKSSSFFISLMVITSLAILFLGPACAQIVNSSNFGSMPVDNSTGIGEQESGNTVFSFGAIYTVGIVIMIIYCAIKLRKPKTRTKAKILLILLLVVTILLASYEYSGILIFATFLVIGALIILLVPKRTKKQIQWKKRTDIRRQFPIRVRDEVLESEIQVCKL